MVMAAAARAPGVRGKPRCSSSPQSGSWRGCAAAGIVREPTPSTLPVPRRGRSGAGHHVARGRRRALHERALDCGDPVADAHRVSVGEGVDRDPPLLHRELGVDRPARNGDGRSALALVEMHRCAIALNEEVAPMIPGDLKLRRYPIPALLAWRPSVGRRSSTLLLELGRTLDALGSRWIARSPFRTRPGRVHIATEAVVGDPYARLASRRVRLPCATLPIEWLAAAAEREGDHERRGRPSCLAAAHERPLGSHMARQHSHPSQAVPGVHAAGSHV